MIFEVRPSNKSNRVAFSNPGIEPRGNQSDHRLNERTEANPPTQQLEAETDTAVFRDHSRCWRKATGISKSDIADASPAIVRSRKNAVATTAPNGKWFSPQRIPHGGRQKGSQSQRVRPLAGPMTGFACAPLAFVDQGTLRCARRIDGPAKIVCVRAAFAHPTRRQSLTCQVACANDRADSRHVEELLAEISVDRAAVADSAPRTPAGRFGQTYWATCAVRSFIFGGTDIRWKCRCSGCRRDRERRFPWPA